MKNILVSGASGVVGYGILRCLKNYSSEIKLIGTTIYNDSVAQGFSDKFEQALPTSQPNYLDWLLEIIEKNNVDLLIPGIEADLYKWAENSEAIEQTGAKILLNNKKLISICQDKWLFYCELDRRALPYRIESSLSEDYEDLLGRFRRPFLLKPRQGFASKGIVKIENKKQFENEKKKFGSNLMAQPIVGDADSEFTSSIFGDGKGNILAHITLRRTLSQNGFTQTAQLDQPDGAENFLVSVSKVFKPLGPTNVQFRIDGQNFWLLEINPRISSSTSIRSKLGYNESAMALDYFLFNKEIQQPTIKKGRAVRFLEDFIYEDSADL